MTATERAASIRPRDEGRSLLLVVARLLIIGLLLAMVGACVSAAGAPLIGVVDDWGRVDEAASRIASWEYLLVVLVAVLLARGGRASGAVGVLVAAVVESIVVIVAALVGILGVLERKIETPMTTEYYTGVERVGEIAIDVGVAIAAAGLVAFAVSSLRSARRSVQSDEVEDPRPAAGAG